jgi:hypothetical protein
VRPELPVIPWRGIPSALAPFDVMTRGIDFESVSEVPTSEATVRYSASDRQTCGLAPQLALILLGVGSYGYGANSLAPTNRWIGRVQRRRTFLNFAPRSR